MARVNLRDLDKYTSGGGAFFKIADGEKKSVRFLYNTVQEVEESPLLVHQFSGEKFATIDCNRPDKTQPLSDCKWCAMGNKPQVRVIIPMYEEETQQIVYWNRLASFANDNLLPLFENLPAGVPISGQSFIISRTGKSLTDTKYSIAPDMRVMNDMKTKDAFGEVKDAYQLNMVHETDYDFDPTPSAQPAGNAPASTRRTADVF